MPIPLRCPNPSCTRSASVADNLRGRTVRCPACSFKFKVPDPSLLNAETILPGGSTVEPIAARTANLQAPQRIGRFEIKKRLGSGAFGDVYHAVDPQLQREVALKVPRPSVLDTPHIIERFLREGKAAAGLNHPHIVPVFDAGQDGEHYYIAAAFIEGRTLAAEIDAGKVTFERAATLVQALAEALAYAHQQGVVHRDVKPANVLLDAEGEPYLTDFGLAARHEVEDRLTRDGAVMGTPAYMPPEQAQGQQGEAKPAVDQYALGVMLYEMLTGGTPFQGDPAFVLYNVIHKEPDAPSSRNPKIPRDLETICLKAMARDADKRYRNCQELADDLRRWLAGEPIQARRRNPLVRVGRWVKKEPKLVGLGALTIICLTIVSTLAQQKGAELRSLEQRTVELTNEAVDEEARTRKAEEASLARKEVVERELADARTKQGQAAERQKAAEDARRRQAEQTDRALAAEKNANEQERQRRLLLYKAYLELADGAMAAGDRKKALNWLERCTPKAGEDDLRDDQWARLAELAKADVKVAVQPPPVEPKPKDPPAQPKALPDPGTLDSYRDQVGKSFVFRVTGNINGSIYGTGFYTDDSTLATAAVHAGALRNGETGLVEVAIHPGRAGYAASLRYGVTSSSWGAYEGSYSVRRIAGIAAPPAQAVPQWNGSLARFRGRVGVSFVVEVTGDVQQAVWGTDVYTDDSHLASAVVHAGLLKQGETGKVKVTILRGLPSYNGSFRNGVRSGSYGSWSGSYRVEAVK